MIWFESFLLGRIANLSLHEIGKRATCIGNRSLSTDDLRRALEFLKTWIINGPPIEVSKAASETSYVFTDGAFGASSADPGTIGGILYSGDGLVIAFFSEVIPETLTRCYMQESNPHLSH